MDRLSPCASLSSSPGSDHTGSTEVGKLIVAAAGVVQVNTPDLLQPPPGMLFELVVASAPARLQVITTQVGLWRVLSYGLFAVCPEPAG